MTSQAIQFETSDHVTIVGDLYLPAGKPTHAAILLHMLPATRTSWKDFAPQLKDYNYAVLAIDLRGHGDSIHQNANTLDYRSFTDQQQQASIQDVEAALSYLTDTVHIPQNQIGLIGASIGANLALQTLASHHALPWAVLLSPGLDYNGIQTEPLMDKLASSQKLFLAASDNDLYSLETDRRLHDLKPNQVTVEELKAAGHGTDMFTAHPDLVSDVLIWIKGHTTT